MSDEAIAQRRTQALASIRSLSPSEFVARTTSEALAAGLVFAPVSMFYFSIYGMFEARYPAQVVGQVRRAPPNTFGALAAAGLKFGLSGTVRTVAWLGATAALSSTLREVVKTGARHEDNSLANPFFHGAGFIGGAVCADFVTRDWRNSMSGMRRGFFVTGGGLAGVFLPVLLARTGPLVRQKLMNVLSGQ